MAKTRSETTGASVPKSALQAPPSGRAGSEPVQSAAPFAVTSDGAIIMNVGTLDSINVSALEGRIFFVGVELAGSERRLARKVLDDAGHDLRARIAGASASWRATKPKPKVE